MAEPDYVVLRPAFDLHLGLPPHLDGVWFDRARMLTNPVAAYAVKRAVATGRFEVRESDGAVAEVFEVQSSSQQADTPAIRYAIECHSPRAKSLQDLDTVVYHWVSTGWIERGSPAETDRALAEERLAAARARNEGTEYRIVEVPVETSAGEGFLLLLKAEPTLLPEAPADAAGEHIERRRLDEVHACLRCGGRADCAFIAATELGPRWLDLCNGCTRWLRNSLAE